MGKGILGLGITDTDDKKDSWEYMRKAIRNVNEANKLLRSASLSVAIAAEDPHYKEIAKDTMDIVLSCIESLDRLQRLFIDRFLP